ncbi:MAG: hypothetical protein A2234_09650 [Elusimicrobia bacterium RIFOXYA2_FULL_58_8]|nr:MAG: hypothetical protein A2285_06940 [Elusimicrobia bacterium RIFOXYA12_FULL_57_11]OGS14056.1 MAG: hypothetical protein A2234_09650 [Elusimicrobia bacterium RIFOXYA2_FULL_58_8]
MKNLVFIISVLSLMAASACAGAVKGGPGKPRAQFKAYTMDNDHFSCSVPAAWTLEREKEKDDQYKIYEIQLLAPVSGKAPTSVFVSYYAKDNEDFNGYQDYIDRHSKNALGETKSVRENYEPAKKITLGGRKGFELGSEVLEYLHPESKSDESVQLKEKIYVLPAKEGFYALRFNAPKAAYLENLAVFEKVARSFKGKP